MWILDGTRKGLSGKSKNCRDKFNVAYPETVHFNTDNEFVVDNLRIILWSLISAEDDAKLLETPCFTIKWIQKILLKITPLLPNAESPIH